MNDETRVGGGSGRARGRVAAMVWVSLVCAAGAAEDGAPVSPLKDARLKLEKWVEAEQLISKERLDWELGKQILEDRVGLVEREIKELGEKTVEARKKAEAAGSEIGKLRAERDTLEQAAAFLAEKVPTLERRVQGEVLPLLPDTVRQKVDPLVRRLPENPAESKLTLLERYQNVVGILNEVDKFNREVVVAREIRAVGDGKTAEVRTMYLGLGQAFYANPEKGVAGRGVPTEGGWKWEELPAAVEKISEAIGISENEKVADFVPLPVKVQ